MVGPDRMLPTARRRQPRSAEGRGGREEGLPMRMGREVKGRVVALVASVRGVAGSGGGRAGEGGRALRERGWVRVALCERGSGISEVE